jgi:hypothetical protein
MIEGSTQEFGKRSRGLNRKHIEALARHFKVNPAVFISA